MRKPAPSLDREAGSRVLDEIVDRITGKLQAGEPLDLDVYARRYPELEDQLRKLLPGIQMLVDLGHSPAEAPSSEGPDTSVSHKPVRGVLGDYRIVREIGRGGMGVVYEAEQVSLGRKVALKVLPFAAMMDQKQLQRFQNEARAAASLRHPNVVQVHFVGCERAVHFYAMDYIEGQTLAELIRHLRRLEGLEGELSEDAGKAVSDLADSLTSGRFAAPKAPSGPDGPTAAYTPEHTPAAAAETKRTPQAAISTERSTKSPAYFRSIAEIGVQVAEALDHAHQNGVIHRDVKPSNVILDNQSKPWVTDFGLARVETEATLTVSGDLLGTVRYMSPEQALAKRIVVDHRTDVYSLGVTLYELLTLQAAFSGQDRQELLRQIAFEEPAALRRLNKAVPAELEIIVTKAMAKNPAERYDTAQELADDLKRFLADEPIRARRPSLAQRTAKCARRHRAAVVAAACVGLGLLILGAVAGWNRHQQRTVIERGVGESLAAARAFLQAADYAAAGQELAEAQGQLGAANWKEGPLPAAAQSVADELSARTRAEERFNRFRELQDLTRASMYRSGDLKRLEYCRAALSLYQVLEAVDWRTRPEFQDLRTQQRRLVEEGVAELLFALARLQVVTTYTTGDRAEGHRRAIDALRRIETFHEPVPAAYRWMAESWEALGEHKLASDAAQRAAALPARTALDYYMLGDYYVHQNQAEKASASFAQALDRQPDHFLSFLRSGLCFRLMRRYDLAEAMLTGAIALNPRAGMAYYHRGGNRQSLGKLDLALADYRKVAELDPQNYLAPYSQAILLRRKGDLAQAVALLDKVVQLNPNSFSSHLHRGFVYRDLGQYEKAEADFSRVVEMTTPLVELDHKNWDWKDHLALGYLHRGLVRSRQPGRYRDAVTDADKACASASMSDSPNVFLPANEVLYDAACVYSLASAQAAKDETEAEREALARRYADRAVELLRQAIEKGYKGFDHMRKDPDLDPIRQHAGLQELLKPKKDNQQPAPSGGTGR